MTGTVAKLLQQDAKCLAKTPNMVEKINTGFRSSGCETSVELLKACPIPLLHVAAWHGDLALVALLI